MAYQKVKLAKSHLTLDHIVRGTITFSEIDTQGAAGEHFPLPKWLAAKKALINIQGNENECFKHSVACSLNIEGRNNTRLTPLLREKIAQFDWPVLSFQLPRKERAFGTLKRTTTLELRFTPLRRTRKERTLLLGKDLLAKGLEKHLLDFRFKRF